MEILNSLEFYDRLAGAFDVMTDWNARLALEMPFLQRVLEEHNARSILDAACGTGWHAIALAQKGYQCVGSDASRAMIERARGNAEKAGAEVRFEVAEFTELGRFPETFDAVLCLGNSLPHLLSREELLQALSQMRDRLHSGGVLILQNLNYDLRLKTQPRFFSVNGSADVLVWRFADYGPEFITFHTALFERKEGASGQLSWSVQVNSTLQRPLRLAELDQALLRVGFTDRQQFGGLDGSLFDRDRSSDLVVVAGTK